MPYRAPAGTRFANFANAGALRRAAQRDRRRRDQAGNCRRARREFGHCYYTPSSLVAVASVDTLARREVDPRWAQQVTLVISDEGHHVVLGNKWAAAFELFPNARGLLPTATPSRADGKGLGRPDLGGSGIADAMVLGPPMRWLIEQGFLTRYRIICVESDLRLLESEVSANGDWSTKRLKEASEKSRIVGDVVRTYLQYAAGAGISPLRPIPRRPPI